MYATDSVKRRNHSGIKEYLDNKMKRLSATFRICCDGSSHWILNGTKLTEEQFNSMFPTELIKHNVKGERIDSKQRIY